MQEVCRHGRCRSFAVCSGHAESFLLTRQHAQRFCPLLELKTFGFEPRHFAMVGRNGRGIDHQRTLSMAKGFGNARRVVFKVEIYSFFGEGIGQCRRRTVIATHVQSLLEKIAF